MKGIAVADCAANCHATEVCHKFFLASPSDWRLVQYPWLQRYHPNLPVDGEFPFVPPVNWQVAQLHGDQHGLLDRNGNEWRWDLLHRTHWDVQLSDGRHLNVSTEGRLL